MDAMLRGEPVLLRNSGVVGKLDAKFNADSKIGLAQVWNFDHLAKILGVPDDGGTARPRIRGNVSFAPRINTDSSSTMNQKISSARIITSENQKHSRSIVLSTSLFSVRVRGKISQFISRVALTKDSISRKTMSSSNV